MNPIRIGKLDHVVLRVADIEKSIRFYRDILGCPEARTRPDTGLYQYRAGASMIDLVPLDSPGGRRSGYGPPSAGRNMEHFALAIEEFDEAAIRGYLAANGVEITKAGRRFGADGTGPSIYVKDPDGNEVELKGPPEEAEQAS
jgi:catechol 2,3-dioxygenase-like lactoylglutathione lyase family enzyme